MKKLNKLLGMVVLGICLLAMSPGKIKADECNYIPYGNSGSSGDFHFGADFIYWKPCVDDLDYASVAFEQKTGGTSPTFEKNKYAYKCLCLDWEPGFRIRFGKDNILCNWNLSGSYLWLNVDSTANCEKQNGEDAFVTSPLFAPFLFEGNNVEPSGVALTFVKGRYENTYQNWDALVSYNISCNRCHSFQPFFGVEGLIFNQKLVIDGFVDKEDKNVNQTQVKWIGDYFGVGLKMGSAYVFEFNCFKFYANAAGTILVGDHDANNKQTRWDQSGNEFEFDFKDADCCLFVPGVHLAIGLLYEREACGCEYAIRLGWELVQWHNISNPKRFYITNAEGLRAAASASDYTTVGFHGLVAGFDLSF